MTLFSRDPSSPVLSATTPTAPAADQHPATDPRPAPRGRLGWIVAASLTVGVLAAMLLVAAPFIPVTEPAITGAVLIGFALGWTLLWLLSRRFTDQPQHWAAAPALFMGAGGLLLLAFGSPMRQVLSWIWPPVLQALAVWMVIRVHRDMRSRAGRVQLYAVFTILAVCAVGGGWQTVSSATETNPYLTSGRLIDVGGHQMHLSCTGSGSPTVVLEPGAGGTSASMGWVAPAVAKQTRVCVYDRAGRGGSEPAGVPQDGARVATDLHALLHEAGVPAPYVLAGHSFGGLYVRTFAAHYPDEVAGLVLIDSTASQEPAKSVIPAEDDSSYDGVGRFATLVSLSARIGLTQLYGELVPGTLPPRSEEMLKYDTAQASTVRSVVEEYLRGGGAREAATLTDFGDKPLFVLTAGEGHPPSWFTDQEESATLSTNSVHEVVEGATHQGLEDEEQYAAHVTQAVRDVVTSVRTGQQLNTDGRGT
ncbi:alpha/beta fold hydrolase [Nocardioides caldifontis]|uniref:alpha/beta fold hydrolase n=1 Tax=Nocardioides caldifontis TaxID=2588938 RepID=UPI0011DFC639|nr:alpha/beta fold hydrolase [Nocardioides caldifontis]